MSCGKRWLCQTTWPPPSLQPITSLWMLARLSCPTKARTESTVTPASEAPAHTVEGADGIDGDAGVGSAGPHRVSLPRRGSGRWLRPDLGKAQSAGEGGSGLTARQLHNAFTTGVRASTGVSAGRTVNG